MLVLLLSFVLLLVIVWAIRTLMAAFGIGEPITTVVYVLLVVIVIVWLLQALGGVRLPMLR